VFKVVDASSKAVYTGSDDYSWTIEEDTTFHTDQLLRPTGGRPGQSDTRGRAREPTFNRTTCQ